MVAVDKEGFLIHWQDWNETIAREIAMAEKITLTENHMEIILMLRHYYQEYQHIPPMRGLSKVIKKMLGEEKAHSIYLYELFPGGPVKQGCKIAGLPKPPHCI